jgi:plastocyanin
MKRIVVLFTFLALLALPAAAFAAVERPSTAPVAASGAQMSGSSVTIANFAFQPAWISVPAGTTVSWFNGDGVSHTVTSDSGAFDSGAIAPGGSFGVTFSTPGTYTYHCAFHPMMTGTVVVTGM